jgi:hypothetical protein
MAIYNIVPRKNAEGSIGLPNKKWQEINAVNVKADKLLTTGGQDLLVEGDNIEIVQDPLTGQYTISSDINNLVIGGLNYKGKYDASIGVPDLTNAEKGWFYKVSAAGNVYGIDWEVGDHLIVNADMGGILDFDKIDKIDNTESISVLNDIVDVEITNPEDRQALVFSNGEWVNGTIIYEVPDLEDVFLEQNIKSVSYTSSYSSLALTDNRDHVIDCRRLSPVNGKKVVTLPGTLVEGESLVYVTNIGGGELQLRVSGSTSFGIGDSTPRDYGSNIRIKATGTIQQQTIGGVTTDYMVWSLSTESIGERQVLGSSNDLVSWGNHFLNVSHVSGAARQGEIDTIKSSVGLAQDGTFVKHENTNFLNNTTTFKSVDLALDTALKGEQTSRISSDNNLQSQITSNLNEINSIEQSVGLESDGTISPWASTFNISPTDSIKVAVESLDDEMERVRLLTVSGVDNLQAELDNTQDSLGGMTTAGTFNAPSGTNYIDTATSFRDTDIKLDAAIKSEENARISADTGLQSQISSLSSRTTSLEAYKTENTNEVNEIEASLGLTTSGTFSWVSTASTVINSTVNFKTAIESLDDEMREVRQLTVSGVDNLQAELDNTQASLGGMTSSGTFSAPSGTNYIDTATSFRDVDLKLDTAIINEYNARIAADDNLQSQIDSLPTFSGSATFSIGTNVGDIVQLENVNGSAGLPAVDGSQLTGITTDVNSSNIEELQNVTVTSATLNDGLVYSGSVWTNVPLQDVAFSGETADLIYGGTHTFTNYTPSDTNLDSHLAAIDNKFGDALVNSVNGISPNLGDVTITGDDISTSASFTSFTISQGTLLKIDGYLEKLDAGLKDALDNRLFYSVAYANDNSDVDLIVTPADAIQKLIDKNKNTNCTIFCGPGNHQGAGMFGYSIDFSGLQSAYVIGEGRKNTRTTSVNIVEQSQTISDFGMSGLNISYGNAINCDIGTLTFEKGEGNIIGCDIQNIIVAEKALNEATIKNSSVASGINIEIDCAGKLYIIDSDLKGLSNIINDSSATYEIVLVNCYNIDQTILDKVTVVGPIMLDDNTTVIEATSTTQDLTDSSTKLATTEFVSNKISSLTTTASGSADAIQITDGSGSFVEGSWKITNNDLLPNAGYNIGNSSKVLNSIYSDAYNVGSTGLSIKKHATKSRPILENNSGTLELGSDELVVASDLSSVAISGDFTDLTNAPTSNINNAVFITDEDPLTLEAGRHYIISTATASNKVLTLPDVTDNGDYIRITNWGLGNLIVQVDQTDDPLNTAHLLVGQEITNKGSVTIESKATVDLFGFNYSQGGYDYSPAWGVYFSSSIEMNTRSFNTTGQIPVFDNEKQELFAGDLGDLTFSYVPTTYASTLSGVTLSSVQDHFTSIDNFLADSVTIEDDLSIIADVSYATLPVANDILVYDGTNWSPTAITHPLASTVSQGILRIATDLEANGTTVNDAAIVPSNISKIDLSNFNNDVFLERTSNLADLPNKTSARSNLGLGTSAVRDVGTNIDEVVTIIEDANGIGLPPVDGSRLTGVLPGINNITTASPADTYTVTTHTGALETFILNPTKECTVTLPTAATVGAGYMYNFKNLSQFSIILNDTIDGLPNFEMPNQYSAVTIVSDGTNWYVL